MPAYLSWLLVAALLLACPGGSRLVETRLTAGDQLLREGRIEEAIASYQEAIEASEGDARPWRRKAIALVLAKRDGEALLHFEQAATLDSRASAEELVFWATALQRTGQVEQAVSRYEAALEANPDHTPAMNNLASLLHEADPKRATRLLERAVSLEPGDAQLVYNLGRLYEKTGRFEEAFNLIQRATASLDFDDPVRARRQEHLERLRGRLPQAPAPRKAPNFLLVVIDTLRADHMGSYGYERPTTPRMDALAREAVVFEDAVAQAPWTAPSLATLFTGLYPSVHGLDTGIDLGRSFDPSREARPMALQKALSPSQRTLAEVLRRHGYATFGFVSQIYVNSIFGFSQGFDLYRDAPFTTEKIRGEATNQAVFEWLDAWKRQPQEPFLLFVHYNDPHFPYDPPQPFGQDFVAGYEGDLTPASTKKIQDLLEERELDAQDVRYVTGLYDGEIAYVDTRVGELVERVRGLDLSRPLVTVITSDHGEEFLEHGGTSHGFTLFEEQLRVPLIVHAPGLLRARRVAGQVRLLDLMPTLLDLVGLDATQERIQGTSFAPLLRGRDRGIARRAFSEATWKGDQRSVRTDQRLKLIVGPEPESLRLFDLGQDPDEQEDLSAERAQEAQALAQELTDWSETNRRLREELAHESGMGEIALDERTRSQLQALGYLD